MHVCDQREKDLPEAVAQRLRIKAGRLTANSKEQRANTTVADL
jgi:hypothetical protein